MHLSQEAFSRRDCSLAMLLCDWTNIYVHQQVSRDSLRKTQRECSRLHDVCTLNLQATYIGSYETRYPQSASTKVRSPECSQLKNAAYCEPEID